MDRPVPPPPPAAPAAALDYPFAEPPAAGTVREVVPGLLWVRMALPFALDHINLWLVRDGAGWAMVDTGIHSATTLASWDAVLALPQVAGRITRILVTHYHPDHFGLAGHFSRARGLTVWMTEAEYLMGVCVRSEERGWSGEAVLEFFRVHGLDDLGLAAVAARDHSYPRLVSDPPHAFHRILDGDRIAVGDTHWQVVTGYGHSPEHAALYCADLGVLIAGDMVLPRISTNISVWPTEPALDPVRLFLGSLERYGRLPADTLVLPSHGLPFRGLRARTTMLAEHHRLRLADLRAACTRPLTAAEAVPVLFRRQMDGQQMFFAMGEAVAHLNHLMQRGELERTQDADGVLRFALHAAAGV